jgi:hypothetical protein
LFIAEISFLCWTLNVSHHAVVCLVHPLYCCKVAPGPYLNVPPISVSLSCIIDSLVCASC